MPTAGTGNRILFGLRPEIPITSGAGPSYDWRVGAPSPDQITLAAPAGPTVGVGSSGNVTNRSYKISHGTHDGGETPASVAVPGSGASKVFHLTVIPKGTDTRIDRAYIYGDDGGGKDYGWIGALYHNTVEGTVFAGSGLNDATFSGTYSAIATINTNGDAIVQAEIDGVGTPDTFKWRISTDGGKTFGSYTTLVAITGSAQTLSNGISITFAATTGHTLAASWTNSTWVTKWDDNLAPASVDYSRKPKSVSTVGQNDGFRGVYVENPKLTPMDKQGASAEQRGQQGPARYFPSETTFDFDVKNELRPGYNVPMAASQYGKYATMTERPNEPTCIYVLTPEDCYDAPVSFSGRYWEGSKDLLPEDLWGLQCQERQIKIVPGKTDEFTCKVIGINRTQRGPGSPNTTTGTYWNFWRPSLRGVCPTTEIIDGKITTAPAAGTFGVKFKKRSSGTFDGPEITFAYDATTLKQVKAAGWFSAWPELYDETSTALGLDIGENRLPLECYFAGDVTQLALNDTFFFPVNILIPGSGVSPYSGAPLRQENEFRLTGAHFQFLRSDLDGSVANNLSSVISADVKITRTLTPFRQDGAEAKVPTDIDATAAFMWDLTLVRRYENRIFQQAIEQDARLVIQLALLGSPIIIQPGVKSNHTAFGSTPDRLGRAGIMWDVPQFDVTETPSRTPSGRNIIDETIKGMAEQPDDVTLKLVTETIATPRKWRLAA